MSTIFKIVRGIVSSTEDKDSHSYKETMSYTMITFSAFVITMMLLLLIGKTLWNEYLIEVIPGIRRIDSVFQLAAIFLLTQMLFS